MWFETDPILLKVRSGSVEMNRVTEDIGVQDCSVTKS